MCRHCGREVSDSFDNGHWVEIRTCPNCGRFSWDRPQYINVNIDTFAETWRQIWFQVGFAVELHVRWIARPWLTRAICACHPALRVL